jgi:hypothetical protein
VIGLIKVHYTYTYEGRKMQQQEICMKKNHERHLGEILVSMARLNNLGKILVISWQDLAKISVLPRTCHDLPRSCKILQDRYQPCMRASNNIVRVCAAVCL